MPPTPTKQPTWQHCTTCMAMQERKTLAIPERKTPAIPERKTPAMLEKDSAELQ